MVHPHIFICFEVQLASFQKQLGNEVTVFAFAFAFALAFARCCYICPFVVVIRIVARSRSRVFFPRDLYDLTVFPLHLRAPAAVRCFCCCC